MTMTMTMTGEPILVCAAADEALIAARRGG